MLPVALAEETAGTSAVINATLNDIGNVTNVSTLPLNIPYCALATLSVIKFFNPLTTVIESIFLLIVANTGVNDIGIDTLSISNIILLILLYL